MTDVVLNNITSGYNVSKINDNFDKIQSNINTDAIKKSDGNNVMDQDLDLNSNDLLNVNTVSATSVNIGGVAVVPGDTLTIPPGTVGSTEINPSYDATLTHVADLASTSAGKGASLIGYLTGTGAIGRTVQDRLRDTLHYKDFGAKCDGVTDDSAAMSALIAACSASGTAKRVIVQAGTSILSQGFTISTPIRFVGEGQIGSANGGIPAANGTTFKYTGAAGATFFKLNKVNNGNAGFDGINLDCNALAAYGLDMEDVLGTSNRVSIINFTHVGLKIGAPTTTSSWNAFDSTFIDDGGHGDSTSAAIYLTGVVSGGNACHNTFVNTRINISGPTHGIYLGGCDNNSFLMTFIYRSPGGTGHGVHVDPTEQINFPINNTFYHLQASTGGWYQPSTTVSVPAFIYGYMQDNGQPNPVLNVNGGTAIISPDIVYPATVAVGTGWSGGAPTLAAYYSRNGRKLTLTISITGTGVIAAANATITGIPANTGNPYGFGVVTGINATSGNIVYGYISGNTLTLSSGISTTANTHLQATFLI